MRDDTHFYMGVVDDDPEYRLARELYLTHETRRKVGDILRDAERHGLSRRNTLIAVRSVLGSFEQSNFDKLMQRSYWQDWPFGYECTAIDEESMMKCRCNSCIAYRMRRSHEQRQAEEFESMLEELREKVKKPWYKGWSADDPRPNPGKDRPRNIHRHFTLKRLDKDTYECEDCGKIGDIWDIDYTPCPNSKPPHEQKKLKDPTWGECTLCNTRWKYIKGSTVYGDCLVTGQNHGWMDPKPLRDNSLYTCGNCNQTGPFHELAYSTCPDPDLTPCDYCNIAGMCAADCPGMGQALAELIEDVVEEDEEDDQEAWGKPWAPDY